MKRYSLITQSSLKSKIEMNKGQMGKKGRGEWKKKG